MIKKKNMGEFKQILICLSIAFSLSACDSTEKTIIESEYLVPQLRTEFVESISLRSNEGHTQLSRKDGRWWVNKPIDYAADTNVIESLLRTLGDAEPGKKIKVSDKDLATLNLDAGGSGIEIQLGFDQNKQVKLIVGTLDYSKKDSGIMGVGYSARRHIRVISDTDNVYLVPISLVDLSASPSLWTDARFIQIPSFQSVLLKSEHGEDQYYYREHPFGALYQAIGKDKKVQVNPRLFRCLELFLAEGRCLEQGGTKTQLASTSTSEVIIRDFLGLSYTFNIGGAGKPTEQAIERAQLQAGFLSDGEAPIPVPFTVSVSDENLTLNVFEQSLKEKNLAIISQMSGRLASAAHYQFECITNLLEAAQ